MRSKLRQARLNKKLLQTTVAKAIGVTSRMYQYIENGQRNPSWEVAQRLEQYFGIPASELLEVETDEPQSMAR